MELISAPNIIGLTSKSRFSAVEESLAFKRVLESAVYNDFILPVIYGNKVIGWVCGDKYPSRNVYYYKKRIGDRNTMWTGFNNLDDIINETSNNGKSLKQFWCKRFAANATTTAGWMHLAALGGYPTYESFAGTARTARQFDESSKPAIAHGGNVSTDTKHILSASINVNQGVGVYILYDLVLSYDQCTPTNGSQSMTNTLTAQRYATNSDPGLRIMGVTTTAIATASTFTTLTYVDNAGNTGQTIPNPTDTTVAAGNTITGDVEPLSPFYSDNTTGAALLCVQLNTGDTGVQKISNYTMSATPASGKWSFLLGYPLVYMSVTTDSVTNSFDFVKQLPSLARVYDGACLTLAMYSSSSNQFTLFGEIAFGWG